MKIIKLSFELLVLAIIITQIILPVFIDKPLFWFFKKGEAKEIEEEAEKTLDEEVTKVKQAYDETKEKVEDNFSKADKLKTDLDNIAKK